jgi:hypothetical protein
MLAARLAVGPFAQFKRTKRASLIFANAAGRTRGRGYVCRIRMRPTANVRAVMRADLNLVRLAMRAGRKVIDKIVDGLK